MLVEHMIEPEFLIEIAESRRNYKDFIREFSRQSPRVISDIQKFNKFRSKTLKTQPIGVSEEEKNRLDDLLQFIAEAGRVKRHINFDGQLSYLENFIIAENEHPVDFFLLKSDLGEHKFNAKVISIDDFENGIESLPDQYLVSKSVDNMINVAINFLRLSSHITFVDPYFNNSDNKWRPMMSFLSIALENSPTTNKHIQILFSGKEKPSYDPPTSDYLRNKMIQQDCVLIESFDSLKISAILEKNNGEKIHNRYIISDLGALSWGIGLDENHSEVNDDVILLNDALYIKRYEQYAELSGFDVINYAE